MKPEGWLSHECFDQNVCCIDVKILTLTSTQLSGNLSICVKIDQTILRKGDISLAAFFKIKFGCSSGLDAFPQFKFSSNLVTPNLH